ncbi:cell division-specific peptidoglycan biosynthesis regulator FtsW [Desulfitobacterium dichloroeliminans LMG P-21439]|uniref:Probable peptidoglycan glycosyltransferase FtsW n=1 Tax=Desulfitobacterium dichloroeliminans (strain LMG P-21439 / DCA1) TaxID=871963 RepID=L0F7E6_DESDL|nr:putative lipid II flippase FtsW [Desulfitobacterium dichloroeliminans]AGA69764.1 cell division-specific peptidoglycan biosynthesis regulator FtsW [Desulfitobacterium dichloroeliminans LMG P-21439]
MPKKRKRSLLGKLPKPLHEVDFYLLISVLAVLAFGLVMVLTAGSVRGYNETENTFFYVLRQGKWALLGSFFALIITRIPYPFLKKFAGIGIGVTLLLLVLVLNSDSAVEANGASRWLKIGPVNVQPSEIAKIALILFLANYLDRYPVKKLKDLAWPALILIPLLALVYKQPDLGTTLVLVFTAAALLWLTELPTAWFLLAVPCLGAPLFYLIYNTPYQWNRILVWLDPWQYASGMGYQITNAEIAFGSGGIFGVGLGRSMQKFGYLPETYTDMIFALIGEELGLMGTFLLIGLFIFCFGRAFYISRKCPDRFGRLLSFGIAFSLAIQSGINLCVVTGVLPVTGITLPLVSYGGSSLVITLVEIGILLNISRYSQINVPHLGSFSMPPIEGQTLRE